MDNWWEQDEVVQPAKGKTANPNADVLKRTGLGGTTYNFLTAARDAHAHATRPNAGTGSGPLSLFLEGPRNLEGYLNTLKANLAFSELQKMRENSPTGGALGGIAVPELEMLQSTVAGLDRGQSPDVLKAGIAKAGAQWARYAAAQAGVDPNTDAGRALVRQIILKNMGTTEEAVRAVEARRGTKAPAAPGQTPANRKRITSDAEFDALPSGTVFVAPDGTVRRKP